MNSSSTEAAVRGRVLLVDDESSVRTSYGRWLAELDNLDVRLVPPRRGEPLRLRAHRRRRRPLRRQRAGTLLDRAGAALAELECLLIAEIIAGNTISGTPAAACGRVALGVACAVARSLMAKHSTQTVPIDGAADQLAGVYLLP